QITGQLFDKEELLARFLSVFYTHYRSLWQGEWEAIQSAYRTALYRNDGYYSYEDVTGRFEAAIHTIEPSGHLLLQLRDGSIRRYAFKEVKFV
ncbi:MAG: biotin--[acetyl-CoA-carboxylase] ligase, partial [Parabacteroides sp.]|nr:biotin--[acetyl-CoA-carboxylase] ligase [Parabacteroides sp.]